MRTVLCIVAACFVQTGSLFGLEWTPAVTISDSPATDINLKLNVQVAIDSAGNSVAVWEENDFSNRRVASASLPFGGVWSDAVYISAPNVVNQVMEPKVVMDPFGTATAIWRTNDGTDTFIQAATLSAGIWSSPQTISTLPSFSLATPTSARIASDGAGNLIAIWVKANDDNYFVVQAAVKLFGQPWGVPQDISSQVDDAFFPDIAASDTGFFVAIWDEYITDDFFDTMQSATFQIGQPNWSSVTTITAVGAPFDGATNIPRIAVDPAGNAVAVWTRFDNVNGYFVVQAATRPVAGNWTNLQDLTNPVTDFGFVPVVRVDALGNAIAVWFDLNNDLVQSRSLPFGSLVWSPAVNLGPPGNSLSASFLAMDMNRQGQAIAIWDNGGTEVLTSSTTYGSNVWTSPFSLDPLLTPVFQYVDVAINPSGYAVADWARNGFVSLTRASFFTVRQATGVQIKNRFLTQTELVNVITWQPLIGEPPASYRIYRDVFLTQLVKVVPASGPLQFIDHSRKKGVIYTYYIVAVDLFGNELSPTVVVVYPKK